MRAFAVTLLSLFAVGSLAKAQSNDYQNRLVSDLIPMTMARVFVEHARPQTSEEKARFAAMKIDDSKIRGPYMTDLVKIKKMGFQSGSVMDDRLHNGATYQFGAIGIKHKPYDDTKPSCQLTYGPGMAPLALAGDDLAGESRWPAVKVYSPNFFVSSNASSMHLILGSQENEEDAFFVKCRSSDPSQVWSVGLLENIFDDQLNFSESSFKAASSSAPQFSVGQLANVKIEILQAIPKDLSKDGDSSLFIQDGRVFTRLEDLNNDSFCTIQKFDQSKFGPHASKVSQNAKGKVISSSGMSAEMIEHISEDSNEVIVQLGLQYKDGLLAKLARSVNKNYGRMSIGCGLKENKTSVSLDELNKITAGYIRFTN